MGHKIAEELRWYAELKDYSEKARLLLAKFFADAEAKNDTHTIFTFMDFDTGDKKRIKLNPRSYGHRRHLARGMGLVRNHRGRFLRRRKYSHYKNSIIETNPLDTRKLKRFERVLKRKARRIRSEIKKRI